MSALLILDAQTCANFSSINMFSQPTTSKYMQVIGVFRDSSYELRVLLDSNVL
jgi:hypothetical protein